MAFEGVQVIEFNPVMPYKRRFRLDRLTRRDHRKMLVIDGAIGFIGGINIADEWLADTEDGGGWRDDMIEVRGPAVGGMVDCFLADWRQQGGGPLHVPTGSMVDFSGSQRVRVIGQAQSRQRREIVRAYLMHVYTARRRVWLTNSYFVPDPGVTRALVRAARRGVDVRVLLPGRSDSTLVYYASRAMWPKLMKRGVRIFEWDRSILHAKTAVIDGRWSTIGTYNLDTWSRKYNLEVNVAVLDPGFARLMEDSFLRDLDVSREVDPQAFKFRPIGERVLENLAYLLRGWL
jgi:cardiolipin synthase